MSIPTLRDQYFELYFGGLGIAGVGLSNFLQRRPIYARLPMFLLAGAVGYGAGLVVKDWNHKRIANRELAIWDYVQRHPEDFPELQPKKYRDVLDTWHPVR